MFVLDTEGVGKSSPISKKNRLLVDFYAVYDDSESAVPDGCIELDDEDVLGLPVKNEIPLEKFVRQFGNRLEMNFGDWYLLLKKSKPLQEVANVCK